MLSKTCKISRRAACGGYVAIQTLGMIIIALMFSSFAIDLGFYYAGQNKLVSGAEAGALAAAQTLMRVSQGTSALERQAQATDAATELVEANFSDGTSLADDGITFGYVSVSTRAYDPSTFALGESPVSIYQDTGGFNAVQVTVRRDEDSPGGPLNTIFANLFGVQTMNTQATAVAMADNDITGITNGGLRPLYTCQAQFTAAMSDGNLSNNVVRIYGSDGFRLDGANVAGCPGLGSGNRGFADLEDCDPGSVGTSTFGDWLADGFPGTVNVNECYSTKPGNAINSNHSRNALDELIANETVISVPLINTFTGTGSNTTANVAGFAGFVITDYGTGGNSYIDGYFTRAVCSTGCQTGSGTGNGGGVVRLRLIGPSS